MNIVFNLNVPPPEQAGAHPFYGDVLNINDVLAKFYFNILVNVASISKDPYYWTFSHSALYVKAVTEFRGEWPHNGPKVTEIHNANYSTYLRQLKDLALGYGA